MNKTGLFSDRFFSPLSSIYKKFEDSIENISRYVVLPLLVIVFSYFLYHYFSSAQDESFEEFIVQKDFKNSKHDNLDVYSGATLTKVNVLGVANIYGPLTVSQSTLADTNVYGVLKAASTKFQDINVYGAASLKKVRIRDAEIYGFINAEHLTIKNTLVLAGMGHVKNSQINNCELMGTQFILENSDIQKIKVFNTERKNVSLHLRNSRIDVVEFEGVQGEVLFYDEKSAVKSLSGGVITNTKKPFPSNDFQKSDDLQ